jgi:SAM-dependent methyltransferase
MEATETVCSLPFTGGFRFLIPGIAHAGPPGAYKSIVAHLKENPEAKVLDLGCCFGHDARQLLKDGVRPDQITACDLLPELIGFGFELFGDEKDKGHLKGLQWEKVDIFKQSDIDKIKQPGGYHAIYVGSFIHLFPLQWQQKAVEAVSELLSKDKGSIVWGRQVGVEDGSAGPQNRIVEKSRGPTGVETAEDGSRESPFYHDTVSLKNLFDAQDSSSDWDGQVVLYHWKEERGAAKLLSEADGEEMIAPEQVGRMRRLSFAFVRK